MSSADILDSEEVADCGAFSPSPRKIRRGDNPISPPKTWPFACVNGVAVSHSIRIGPGSSAAKTASPMRPVQATCVVARRPQNGHARVSSPDGGRLTNSAPFRGEAIDQPCCRKPDCSYAVLIGIAMRAAQSAGHGPRLPVIEIYRFIEKEFPYFGKCKTTGWKNCVRHCLSLGQFFRKVERPPSEILSAKGHNWEVIPGKNPLLDRDIENFTIDEHRRLFPIQNPGEGGGRADSKTNPKPAIRKSKENPNGFQKSSTSKIPNSFVSHPMQPHLSACHTEAGAANFPLTSPFTGGFYPQPPSCGVGIYDEENPLPPPSSKPTDFFASVVSMPTASNESLQLSPLLLSSQQTTSTDQSEAATKNSSSDIASPRTAVVTNKYLLPNTLTSASDTIIAPPTSDITPDANLQKIAAGGNENEESPFVNPAHPVVTRGTLASINSGATVPHHRAGVAMTTPNFVTYAVAPTAGTWLVSDVVTPTSSGLTATRMTPSVFCGPKPSPRNPNKLSSVPRSTLAQIVRATASHRRHCRGNREDTPPELRPVLHHMHDPSLFLPSRRLYDPPPYANNQLRRRTTCTDEIRNGEKEGERDGNVPTDLKNNARKNFATVSSSSGLAGGGYGVKVDIVKRFGKIVALSVANGNKDEGGSTVEASRLAKEHYARDEESDATEESFPYILANGQTMLSSVQDIASLINDVAAPDYSIGNGASEGEPFFEVANEWSELTIAREEEVTSSEFEEFTSPSDDLHVYIPNI